MANQLRVSVDEKCGPAPRWLRINGRAVNCAEGAERQRDEVVKAIATASYELGYADAQKHMREALGIAG